MQKSPTTDKSLGLSINRESSFAEVRQKATEDYQQRIRNKKSSKNKLTDDINNLPEFKPGDFVVLSTQERKNKQYLLVEIFDFEQENINNYLKRFDFSYFGVIKKTTSEKLNERIGRFISFEEQTGYFSKYKIEKFDGSEIKWLEERSKL